MKYIKIFEHYSKFKYQVGDKVKLTHRNELSDPVFTIAEVDYGDEGVPYKIENDKDGTLSWRSEGNLYPVPDYELDAQKYNI